MADITNYYVVLDIPIVGKIELTLTDYYTEEEIMAAIKGRQVSDGVILQTEIGPITVKRVE